MRTRLKRSREHRNLKNHEFSSGGRRQRRQPVNCIDTSLVHAHTSIKPTKAPQEDWGETGVRERSALGGQRGTVTSICRQNINRRFAVDREFANIHTYIYIYTHIYIL